MYVLLNGQRRHLEVKKNEEEKVRERKRERERGSGGPPKKKHDKKR